MAQHDSYRRAPHAMRAHRLVLGFATILVGSIACEIDDGPDGPFAASTDVEESSGTAASEDTALEGSGATGDADEGDTSDTSETGDGDTDDGGSDGPHRFDPKDDLVARPDPT